MNTFHWCSSGKCRKEAKFEQLIWLLNMYLQPGCYNEGLIENTDRGMHSKRNTLKLLLSLTALRKNYTITFEIKK